MKKIVSTILLLLFFTAVYSQQFLGSKGLIHVPTAEMDTAGVARIGAQFVPKAIMPDRMMLDGEKFDSWTNYLSITPFRWIQFSYGYTLWKVHKNNKIKNEVGFYTKDRYFSIRIQPLQEGPWWPAVAVGGNDVWGSGDDGESKSNYYKNFYGALSKHFELWGIATLGTHVTYRKWKLASNKKYDNFVGGVSLSPSQLPELRIMAEYDGSHTNFGADCTIYHYFQLQTAFISGKHFTAGLALLIPLL